MALDHSIQRLVSRPASSSDVVSAFIENFNGLSPDGEDQSPTFVAMAAFAKLRDLGLISAGAGSEERWVRPSLR